MLPELQLQALDCVFQGHTVNAEKRKQPPAQAALGAKQYLSFPSGDLELRDSHSTVSIAFPDVAGCTAE
jgi:hypothetical protein